MESFFALLQNNELNRRAWATREELRIAIITWDDAHVRSAIAYRELSQGIGPAPAKNLLRALHRDPPTVFLAMFDDAHAQLARERDELRLAREAVAAITAEPLAAPRPSDDMTISELAAALGTTPATLRHWQAEGLLTPHRIGRGRVRTYTPVQVRDARVIHQLRAAGYGIPQLRVILRQLADLGDDGEALPNALHLRDRHLTVRSRDLLRAAAAVEAVLTRNDAFTGVNESPEDVP